MKAFNFNEEEQVVSHHDATLAYTLAAKPSNESFLRTFVIAIATAIRLKDCLNF